MSELVIAAKVKPDIENPRYDQGNFWGRAKHFFIITNPLNLFCSEAELDEAKRIVEDYRHDKIEPKLTIDELWKAKHVYDSAFHPDTKEKMIIYGRMSAQVPMNMMITGSMMTFYKTTPAVVFWQWFNQSFNAVVNYTNRSGDNPIPLSQLGMSYVGATGGALTTALGLNAMVKKMPPIVGRIVPFCAVAAANCINIPLMRQRELREGIAVLDEQGNKLGESKIVAKKAIGMVLLSRVAMATPGMVLPPFLMNYLDKKAWWSRYAYLNAPVQVLAVGFLLVFATPLCCAFFPQKSSVSVETLEPELRKKIAALPNPPSVVYYNKGL